jgi:hypothetical protein
MHTLICDYIEPALIGVLSHFIGNKWLSLACGSLNSEEVQARGGN